MRQEHSNNPPNQDERTESLSPEELEIIELDERLDLAADPLLSFGNKCCGNTSCC